MSNWQAFELGHLDPDSAFREHIFEQFRQQLGQMNSSTSTATPHHHTFQARVADVKAPKSDINALVLDYLTMEGYPDAAAKFSKEANMKPQQEDPSIQTRQEIQHAIHSGNIEAAVTALNVLDPEILDMNPELHFSLLHLQLVELIRQYNNVDTIRVIDFATKHVAPRASTNPSFQLLLQQAMLLLFYEDHTKLPPHLEALLSADLRRTTASKVNEAVLLRHDQRKEAAIRSLVRMRAWAEKTLRGQKKDLPETIDIGLKDNNDTHDDMMELNGHEPMITT